MQGFHSLKELQIDLTHKEKDFILSNFPKGSSIAESQYFDNYDLPCPIKVKVKSKDEAPKCVVLRKARPKNSSGFDLEAKVLALLRQYGLPVPEIIAGPEDGMALLSFLNGENLQHFSMISESSVEKAKGLLLEALTSLENITAQIRKDAGDLLQTQSLLDELMQIQNKAPWNSEKVFKEGVDFLVPVLRQISTPLVFTNGDCQPANFLTDGIKIVGFLDFEYARLRDPLMGLAKYPVYDIHPFNKAGFVEMYLRGRGFTEKQFLPRLALFCLSTMQKEISVHPADKEEQQYKRHVLGLLGWALEGMTKTK